MPFVYELKKHSFSFNCRLPQTKKISYLADRDGKTGKCTKYETKTK